MLGAEATKLKTAGNRREAAAGVCDMEVGKDCI